MSAATPVVADTHALVCYLDTDVASAAAAAPWRLGDRVDRVLEGDHIEGGPPLGEHGDDLTELMPVAQLRDQLIAMLLETAALTARRGVVVSAITIRNVDPELKRQLRIRAAMSGNSMEEEARSILRAALSTEDGEDADLYRTIRRHIEPLGGVELALPDRGPMREPPTFAP